MAAEMAAAGGVSVFPDGSFSAPWPAPRAICSSSCPRAFLFVDEPAMVSNQIDRWWNKVEQRHERSGIGSLIRPEDIYLRPKFCRRCLGRIRASISIQLGAVDGLKKTIHWAKSRSIPGLRSAFTDRSRTTEQLRNLIASEQRIVLAVPRRATWNAWPPSCASIRSIQTRQPPSHSTSETMFDEASYLAGDLRVPVIVRTQIARCQLS